jgi:hypothetical protein
MAATYLVAFSALGFCALSAFTLIRVLSHLDPPDAAPVPERAREVVGV